MYEGVSKCVKRPLSDNTSNNMTNSRANIVETNMWPQQLLFHLLCHSRILTRYKIPNDIDDNNLINHSIISA